MTDARRGGAIAWMASNHVTANIMMLVFLIGGPENLSPLKWIICVGGR